MISHRLKFIFIHIPKTSGNSLSLYLKDLVDNVVVRKNSLVGKNEGIKILCEYGKSDIKHAGIDYYQKIYGEKINDYFKFTIVRNPYDRILSYYFWTKGGKNQTFDRDEFIQFVKKGISLQHEGIDDSFHIVYFENLINVPQGEYSRYLFFYLADVVEKKNYIKAKNIISEVDPLSSSLIVAQAKKWVDQSSYENFNKFFSIVFILGVF